MGKNNQFTSKHVRNVVDQGWPEPEGEQFVVRLVRSRGGNTMECETSEGSQILCLLPAKFSKVVWAQRGDYLIVDPSAAEGAAGKVHHTIVHILFPEQVQHLRKLPCWPEGFGEEASRRAQPAAASTTAAAGPGMEQDSDDSESDLFVNRNHLHQDSYEESEDEDEDE